MNIDLSSEYPCIPEKGYLFAVGFGWRGARSIALRSLDNPLSKSTADLILPKHRGGPTDHTYLWQSLVHLARRFLSSHTTWYAQLDLSSILSKQAHQKEVAQAIRDISASQTEPPLNEYTKVHLIKGDSTRTTRNFWTELLLEDGREIQLYGVLRIYSECCCRNWQTLRGAILRIRTTSNYSPTHIILDYGTF